MGTQTIKFKYSIEEDFKRNLMEKAIRQYNNCVHIAYNLLFEDENVGLTKMKLSTKIYKELSSYNNVDLMSSKIREYATNDAISIKERFGDKRVVFGGFLNLSRYSRKLISKDEFKRNRVNPMTFQGQSNNHGNSFCIVNGDKTITVKLNSKNHIVLKLFGAENGKKDRGTWKLLNRISELQKEKNCKIPVCVKIDFDHVYISFPNTLYGNSTEKRVSNRTFSIDMNPNCIGWSINDWDDSGENSLVSHGCFDISELNKKDSFIRFRSGKSTLKNKRHNEVCIIAKKLAQKAVHFKCNVVAYEKLDFDQKNKDKGYRKLNKLLNRNWCRVKFVNCLLKWLNVYGYHVHGRKENGKESVILEVVASYSSFIGNIVYGDKYSKATPDPVNASIEIGRRAYEFHHQLILKDKEKTDIVFPVRDKVAEVCARALEANGIDAEFRDWKSMKKDFDLKKIEVSGQKNSKDLYRVPFDSSIKWFKSSSKMSYIQQYEKQML